MKTRHLIPFAFVAIVAAPQALAATITWDGNGSNDASGTWSTAVLWDTDTVPGGTDTAVLTDVTTGSRIVTLDTAATSPIQQINFNQSTAGATNVLDVTRSVTVTNAVTLGAAGGTAELRLTPTSAGNITLTSSGGITVSSGGLLTMGATDPGVRRTSQVTGNVTLDGGSIYVTALDPALANAVSRTITGTLAMSSGTVTLDTTGALTDTRLQFNGNATVTGGDFARVGTRTPQLVLSGATNSMAPSSFNTGIQISLQSGSGQTLSVGGPIGELIMRNTGLADTTATKTVTLGASATTGRLAFGVTNANGTCNMVLGSHITTTNTPLNASMPAGAYGSAGSPVNFGINTAGFLLDLNASRGGSGSITWTPNITGGTGSTTNWNLSNSGTALQGGIKVGNVNFSSATQVNVGAGVAIEITGGSNTAINLGGGGTIHPSSRLTYTGTTTTTPATLTTNRSIGDLVVNSAGTLKLLATSLTNAYQQNVTISKGSLIVEANSLLGGPAATPIKLSDGTSTVNSRITLQFADTVTIDRHIDVTAPLGPGPLGTGADSNNQRPRITLSSGTGAVSSDITYGLAGPGAATVLELVAVDASTVLTVSGQIKAPVGQTLARSLLINGGNGGLGTVVLSNAANSYTGGTTLTRGTLILTGDVPASGASLIGIGSLSFADGATPEDETISMLLNGPHTFARASALATNSSAAGTKFTTVIGMAATATGNAVWSGNIGSNSDTRKKTLRVTVPVASSILFSGVIAANAGTGVVTLDKSGAGTVELTGANTYDGDTTVTEGTLKLADNAQLKFIIGDTSGVNNSMTGAGTAVIDGDFVIDTTAAAALTSGSWTLENVTSLTGAYGSTFTVVGFADAGGDKWTKDGGGGKTWTFDELTGVLTLSSGSLTPYENWIATYPQIPLADRDPGDDPDADGSPNILEFALKGDPGTGSNNGMYASLVQDSSSPVGNEFTLVAAVRDGATFTNGTAMVSGITYSVEGSPDLVFPASAVTSTGPSDTAPAATGLESLAGTEWEYHTFKLVASEGLGGRGFLRLKVSQP